jgi:hypothetical protein
MKPIEPWQVRPKSDCKTVRWLGVDGGWRLGRVACEYEGRLIVEDEHRGEFVRLYIVDWEYDNPKDDAGNPK